MRREWAVVQRFEISKKIESSSVLAERSGAGGGRVVAELQMGGTKESGAVQCSAVCSVQCTVCSEQCCAVQCSGECGGKVCGRRPGSMMLDYLIGSSVARPAAAHVQVWVLLGAQKWSSKSLGRPTFIPRPLPWLLCPLCPLSPGGPSPPPQAPPGPPPGHSAGWPARGSPLKMRTEARGRT